MTLKSLLLAALACTAFNAHAALTSYAPWDAKYPNQTGVQFNVVSNAGVTVAMGAHGYKNGVTLPNDGVSVYRAMPGLYPGTTDRANWSFDFAVDLGGCTDCTVHLFVDRDQGAGVSFVDIGALVTPEHYLDSWNMEMSFIDPAITAFSGMPYDFDSSSPSSTAFRLAIFDGAGNTLAASDITVDVPEPVSLGLVGLGLAGMGAALRRRRKA